MSEPNAFSMRKAISGDREALPARRSDRVARRTLRMSAALDTLKPRASMISVLIRSPGWGGFFMVIIQYLFSMYGIAVHVKGLFVQEGMVGTHLLHIDELNSCPGSCGGLAVFLLQ